MKGEFIRESILIRLQKNANKVYQKINLNCIMIIFNIILETQVNSTGIYSGVLLFVN